MKAGIGGLAPTVVIAPINPEQAKYEKLWQHKQYREVAPGEYWALTFLKQAGATTDAEVIDFGCGTGRGGLSLALFGAMKVTLVDFAAGCLDPEVAQACVTQPDRIKFVQADLTKTLPVNAAYGFCCDVLEHIPTKDVSTVIRNILASASHCFFAISTEDDELGVLIGEKLHLTVQPKAWWIDQVTQAGAVLHWVHDAGNVCVLYCSAWRDADEVLAAGKINTDVATVDAQVAQNVKDGWAHVTPYDRQDREVVLLAGGPSLSTQFDEIKRLRESGCCLVTCNGAYAWALERGLSLSAQIVLDAREFNARFARPVVDKCKYLIASQVHPATLEGLPRDRTLLWHSGISKENEQLVLERTGNYFPVPGGSTVVLRAIALLRMLGYWRFHIFGFDSCVRPDGAHHAYAQAENDNEVVVPVTCGGKTFECTPWMLSQASEFRDLVKFLGDEVELAVYGEGLIATMIATGASFSMKEQEHGRERIPTLQ